MIDTVKPGDVIMVNVPRECSIQQLDYMTAHLKEALPKVKIVLIAGNEGGCHVLRPEQE